MEQGLLDINFGWNKQQRGLTARKAPWAFVFCLANVHDNKP